MKKLLITIIFLVGVLGYSQEKIDYIDLDFVNKGIDSLSGNTGHVDHPIPVYLDQSF